MGSLPSNPWPLQCTFVTQLMMELLITDAPGNSWFFTTLEMAETAALVSPSISSGLPLIHICTVMGCNPFALTL